MTLDQAENSAPPHRAILAGWRRSRSARAGWPRCARGVRAGRPSVLGSVPPRAAPAALARTLGVEILPVGRSAGYPVTAGQRRHGAESSPGPGQDRTRTAGRSDYNRLGRRGPPVPGPAVSVTLGELVADEAVRSLPRCRCLELALRIGVAGR